MDWEVWGGTEPKPAIEQFIEEKENRKKKSNSREKEIKSI